MAKLLSYPKEFAHAYYFLFIGFCQILSIDTAETVFKTALGFLHL
ncbi:hypothetical protein J529_4659, partial [Acinetobacter baumannii 99063]